MLLARFGKILMLVTGISEWGVAAVAGVEFV